MPRKFVARSIISIVLNAFMKEDRNRLLRKWEIRVNATKRVQIFWDTWGSHAPVAKRVGDI